MFTIITQIRNEEKRLKDWIVYHNKLGISEFIIYCDDCTDGSESVLNFLKEQYNIKIFQANKFGTYTNSQNPSDYISFNVCDRIQDSYKRGLDYVRELYCDDINHWSIFIEVDEYLVPQTHMNLFDVIDMVPSDINRIYIASYDFKCPFDLDKPVYTQTFMRWSDETRRTGVFKNTVGWFKNRGKSMVRTKNCITDKVAIHDIDNSPYYQNDAVIKMNHYRNFGELQIYDYEDKKILNWI